jgi:hypothetical protein
MRCGRSTSLVGSAREHKHPNRENIQPMTTAHVVSRKVDMVAIVRLFEEASYVLMVWLWWLS